MRPSETLLEMAQRHVRESEDHILRQQNLVQHLEVTRSTPAEEVQALLAGFKSSLDDHKRHLAQIEEEMQSGRRGAVGRLISSPPLAAIAGTTSG